MTDWNRLDTLPHDRAVMLAQWEMAYVDGNRIERWEYVGLFKGQSAPSHDPLVVAVSVDRKYWLRSGTFQNGRECLDYWRWSDVVPLPTEPAF